MSINARMKVSELLEQHHDAEDVLDTYGISLDDRSLGMTLEELCREEAINYWELKSDIALTEGWDGASTSDPFDDTKEEDEESEDEGDWEKDEDDDAEEDDESGFDEDGDDDDDWDDDGDDDDDMDDDDDGGDGEKDWGEEDED